MANLENYLDRTGMEQRLREIDDMLDEASMGIIKSRTVMSPEDFLAFEKAAKDYGATIAGLMVERVVLAKHLDASFRKKATKEARRRLMAAGEQRRIDNLGPRPVGVQLASGPVLSLMTTYLRPSSQDDGVPSAGRVAAAATPSSRSWASATPRRR
jgi:hypothetical protein